MNILLNPVTISVIVMLVLCFVKVNVMISLIVSALFGAVVSPYLGEQSYGFFGSLLEGMRLIIAGMAGKNNVALSYILLGGLAAAIASTGIVKILCYKLLKVFGDKRLFTVFVIAAVASLSQNVIPVHIAFIPILIPPLLYVFNKMNLDRRAVALALTFGLKAPYLFIPMGFGLMFHGIVASNITNAGLDVSDTMVAGPMIVPALGMLVGLIVGVLFVYNKPRTYENRSVDLENISAEELKFQKKHWYTLIAIFICFGMQVVVRGIGSWGWFGFDPASLPGGTAGLGLHLGAVFAILFMFITKSLPFSEMDEIMRSGVKLMGSIAFVMLAAGGFASVMNASSITPGVSSVSELVNSIINISGTSALGISIATMIIGTIVTMGIGTSFGTVPIIAPIIVPLGLAGGLSTAAIICLIGTAAAIGDAGSPASDSTLGPTAGLDADGQHNHIYDTCLPTIIYFNIPLIIFGILGGILL